jgi:hypothetical protein
MTPSNKTEVEMTIETWKIDLERLLWSYHENGRPDGKTGVIGNPRSIEIFVDSLITKAREDERRAFDGEKMNISDEAMRRGEALGASKERKRIVDEVKIITLRNFDKKHKFTNIHIWANEVADFISSLSKEEQQ